MCRLAFIVVLAAALTACKTPHPQPAPPQPTVTTVSKGPASIVVNPYLGWSAAPAAAGTPVWSDRYDVIAALPESLRGTIIIQRRFAIDRGYLGGQVRVPLSATLYVAVPEKGDPMISDGQFADFAGEGWREVAGEVVIAPPEGDPTGWRIWGHPIPPGTVTISSKAIPAGGIFFIGRAREL